MKKRLLYVYAPSGPPIDYALPILAERAEVHSLLVHQPNAHNRTVIERYTRSVTPIDAFYEDNVPEAIYLAAKAHEVDGILTFSEYMLESVSRAAGRLGLRHVGPNVRLGRDKLDMRAAWQAADVSQPLFHEVFTAEDIVDACRSIGMPLLIKPANGAGSIGQQVVTRIEEAADRLADLQDALARACRAGKIDPATSGPTRLIAEQIILSSTQGWYADPTWGDYLSVEGLVRDGVYHPLAITARLPTIPPFIEVSNIAPCPLDAPQKSVIVEAARKAVDALGFENCATHTEMKLIAGGEVQLVETAARMGGVAIAKELAEVFGINYVDLLACILLDIPCALPDFEPTPPSGAAASLSLISADGAGRPWRSARLFAPAEIDWAGLAGDDVCVHVELCQSIPTGEPMPPMFSTGGTLTNAGIAFVTAPDPTTLTLGLKKILANLEHALPLAGDASA